MAQECFVALIVSVNFMNSEIRVLNMESARQATDNAPTPMAFRQCVSEGCNKRMPDKYKDSHTICSNCKGKVCDLLVSCAECASWPIEQRKTFVSYTKTFARKARHHKKSLC